MKLTYTAAPLALLCFVSTAQAQSAQPVELEGVVVTAGRIPVDAQSYARANSIITADEIQQRQPTDFVEVLRQLPGVHVSRGGSLGDRTDIRIRGSEANHVLVLIDGVEAADSATGFDFSTLAPDQIERVEVLRGPQSALYGAGATAGVISIITKSGIRNDVRGSVSVEGGTNPAKIVSGILQAGRENSDAALSFTYRDDEGFDSADDDGEKDGIRDLTLNFKGNADLTDDIILRGSARFTSRESEFDDTSFGCGTPDCYVVDGPNTASGTDVYGSLSADWSLFNDRAVFRPRVSYSAKETERLTPNSFFSSSSDESSLLKIDPQVTVYFGAQEQHAITAVGEYERETFRNSFAGNDDKSRDSYGIGADYQGDITDRLFVQAGVRFDDNEEFDDFISWSASASYALLETGTTLRASIGEAQTNPTFFEQFGFIPGTFTGNPNLEPERNFAWDVGIQQDLLGGRVRAELTYFNETLEDEITGTGTSVTNLTGETDKQGIEAALTASPVAGLSVTASYTFLDTEDANGLVETRRPRHSGGLGVQYSFLDDRARVGGVLTYFGEHQQRDFSDSSFTSPFVTVDEALTLDLNASYKVTDSIEIFGTVKNVWNEDYQEVLGFAAQPRAGYLGVRASF